MEKVKRFLHVEWGGDSHAGRHNEVIDGGWDTESYLKAWTKKKNEWSESYIVRLIDWHLKRFHEEGSLLRLPVLLGKRTDGSYLWTHVAHPLGET